MSSIALVSSTISMKKGQAICNSRALADVFEKQHKNVLRDIDGLLAIGGSDLSSLFIERSDYHQLARKSVRSFDMTKDGFSILAMGFTGPKALQFKLAYINRFNEMEQTLREVHRSSHLGNVTVHEFFFGEHRLRALSTERGHFVLSVDVVYLAYPNARAGNAASGAYTKPLPLGEKVTLTRQDAPELFIGRPNYTFQAISVKGVEQLLRPHPKHPGGRGGKEQRARKEMVLGWLNSEVYPALNNHQRTSLSQPLSPTVSLERSPQALRDQAQKLLDAASSLEALETAKARAQEALALIA